MTKRPYTTVVLAMSADGKIADYQRSHPGFGSAADLQHLETQVAAADGVLMGASTLRAGGTAMRVMDANLIQQRQANGQPEQPVQILASASAAIDAALPFFRQPIPRWLLTTAEGATLWEGRSEFERILIGSTDDRQGNWHQSLRTIADAGIQHLAVLGGGELVASLFAIDGIDELWLTVCPVILGGTRAPTPVDGMGFAADVAPRLQLLEAKPYQQEVFLHYRVVR
ncbi:RibD family protein [Geitlerinema sp. PCC 9228]|jgi:5-amino-6-(5-phosphoribosylamino)uracil reductase|uniref:RibD family protein n=1 Tax=Geitlerinema sp. PCC 9228 TaxID=111611 RepID=UPI0008F9DC82|nr:RibD family protein [Geitlerinema sp. PCC 9228]